MASTHSVDLSRPVNQVAATSYQLSGCTLYGICVIAMLTVISEYQKRVP